MASTNLWSNCTILQSTRCRNYYTWTKPIVKTQVQWRSLKWTGQLTYILNWANRRWKFCWTYVDLIFMRAELRGTGARLHPDKKMQNRAGRLCCCKSKSSPGWQQRVLNGHDLVAVDCRRGQTCRWSCRPDRLVVSRPSYPLVLHAF
jgi:hypothetical protein